MWEIKYMIVIEVIVSIYERTQQRSTWLTFSKKHFQILSMFKTSKYLAGKQLVNIFIKLLITLVSNT